MALKIKNQEQWASALLGALGEPDSSTNVSNITAWEGLEGGNWDNTATYNPLNTSEPESGSTNYNTGQPGGGVQAYTSWKSGLDATVATLEQGNDGYPQILADLNTSQPYDDFLGALKGSDWDAGHYAGVSGATPATSAPSDTDYDAGVQATIDSGNTANSPSTSTNPETLTGMAGILQSLDAWYSPTGKHWSLDPITDIENIGGTLENTIIMVFTRTVSSVIGVALLLMGIRTFLSGAGGTSGGGATNVLEFVNNAKISNAKIGQAGERISASAEKEAHVGERHEQRLADKERDRSSRERVASTPKVNLHFKKSQEEKYSESHIYHHTTPKPNNQNAKERGLKQ